MRRLLLVGIFLIATAHAQNRPPKLEPLPEAPPPPGEHSLEGTRRLEAKPKPSGASYSFKWREISKNWVTFNTAPHVVALTIPATTRLDSDAYVAQARQHISDFEGRTVGDRVFFFGTVLGRGVGAC